MGNFQAESEETGPAGKEKRRDGPEEALEFQHYQCLGEKRQPFLTLDSLNYDKKPGLSQWVPGP